VQARRPSQVAHRHWLTALEYLDEKPRCTVDCLGASSRRLTVLIHIVHTVSHIADGKTGQLSSATDQLPVVHELV